MDFGVRRVLNSVLDLMGSNEIRYYLDRIRNTVYMVLS